MKRGLGITVIEAAQDRINHAFDNFEKVYVSFSAGKDSTVMLHMVMDEAIKRDRKVGILLIDLEAQYELTIDHARKTFEEYDEHAEIFWVCLPLHLRNAVSVYEPFWKCWDNEAKDVWVRDLPDTKWTINDPEYFDFFHDGMEFEEFVPLFGEWYSEGTPTACLVGIRSDESLNRYRTIASRKKEMYNDLQWTTRVTDNTWNIYPIYDWNTSDIWVYHAKNKDKRHNQLYDYMHLAGLTVHQMRICQPYGDDQRRGLWLYHLIEPQTWSKVVARVNGANGGSLYMQEWGNINGYRKVTKPDNCPTWRDFAKLLIASMPPKTREHYKNKIYTFEKWWMDHGYPEGIPDAADYQMEQKRKAPSWRRVCRSLLRNDYWCKGLGFTQHKSDAYTKYLELKRRQRQEDNYKI